MPKIIVFLRGQNTHLAWWAGVVGISVFLFVALGGKSNAEAWVSSHLDGFAGAVNAGLEGIAIVAIYCWFPALIAAFIGRPPWIPQRGNPFVAKDIKP
jgi:hypothetical protein